jgi:hypothetical protein
VALFKIAQGDPDLFQFRKDAALIEAAREQLLASVKIDKPLSGPTLQRLLAMGDQLRKVKEAEHRRLVILQQMIPLERHKRSMTLAGQVVADTVRERTEAIAAAVAAALTSGHSAEQLGTLVLKLSDGRAWSEDMARRFRVAALREPAMMAAEAEGGQDEDRET